MANEAHIAGYYSLKDLGIDNVAFPFRQALAIIALIRRHNVPILGGDVCLIKGVVVYITDDNWYCDQLAGESEGDFARRSCDQAESYINSYKNNSTGEPLFAFVIPENNEVK
ncbi:MAG: hypothetical protein IJV05_07355 [Muribaculaceae bacterium]|nr:hypothetical protein [Muribaculaceae bacterium]